MFLHYRGIGVFWPKIPLNLTSEGLKYPQEVRVQHETCSTICRTPVKAILEKLRFLCFYIIKSMARKGYFGPKSDFRGSKITPRGASST